MGDTNCDLEIVSTASQVRAVVLEITRIGQSARFAGTGRTGMIGDRVQKRVPRIRVQGSCHEIENARAVNVKQERLKKLNLVI